MPVDPTSATLVALLLHMPPAPAEAVSVDVAPGQAFAVPLIEPAAGSPFTVIALVVSVLPQVLVNVYFILVVPVAIPVTIPVVPTIALLVALLLQVPPAVDGASRVVLPAHTVADPVTVAATGTALTATRAVAAAVPQVLVLV
jgi:hypothetical protein